MLATISIPRPEPWFRRLYLPAYSVADCARFAGAHPTTIASWHYRNTPILAPILPGHQRGKPLSYFELVEVAFVAFFRQMNVPMHRIREARDYVKARLTVEYPFAYYRFKTEGLHILMDFDQIEHGTGFGVLVADMHGQLAWDVLMGDKFAQFDYENDLALRWHLAGRASLVTIDPRICFGAPNVKGIPTLALKGRWVAGESVDEIADDFALPKDAVIEGLQFEGIKGHADPVLG